MGTMKLSENPYRWSLPCDVNSGSANHRPYAFLEEAKKNAAMKEDKKYSVNDVESSLEAQRLLDHDSLAQTYQEQQGITIVPTFTSKATLQISATPDDSVPLDLENTETKAYDLETLQTKVLRSKYSVYIPTYRNTTEERKVDENGNALQQTKAKKKKIQTDKNVLAFTAEKVEGHRSDIINDVDKLIQYIKGDNETSISSSSSSRTRNHNVPKSKQQLHQNKQHTSSEESATRSKKQQRAHSSKGKENRAELKKSNSLGEISSVAKLDEFDFDASGDISEADGEGKVVLRGKGSTSSGDRPKERRSWGNVEPPPFQILSSNPSTENLETAESWVVTKPKKKSKKRRNSVSSSRRQNSSFEGDAKLSHRAPSPDLRGKSVCSAPHSEKSNDSSDADSVHSLPVEGSNGPISYADIAKNNERSKKVSPEKSEKHLDLKNSSPPVANHFKMPAEVPHARKSPNVPLSDAPKTIPPDVYDSRNFPAMPAESAVLKSPPPPPANQDCKSLPVDAIEASPPDFQDASSFPSIPTDASPKSCSSTPPDVNNFRSFPVISNNNAKNLSPVVEKTNFRNASVGSCKSKNVSPGDRNVVNKSIEDGVKVGASEAACVVQTDIQNDLTIIHSNEKESIQFNAQMLPPNIPDVQSIEKMHFFNRPPPTTPPRQQHQQQGPTAAQSPRTPPRDAPSSSDNSIHSNSANCDNSERTVISEGEEEGGCGSPPPPPPVVILSGNGNKEVMDDLEFGFDVNEQLLNEDACETFAARYRVPEDVYDGSSHNHDKIVNFIGSSWEAVVNQSNGVQYYKEES